MSRQTTKVASEIVCLRRQPTEKEHSRGKSRLQETILRHTRELSIKKHCSKSQKASLRRKTVGQTETEIANKELHFSGKNRHEERQFSESQTNGQEGHVQEIEK
eukprot:TRINITY_DN6218_c0_g1_i1.p1 TRINITY_DN6218_c0_g1~~TRINITY_DN6218_c0_g1_i1.p1  ORF type:complete len:104 (+),score=4.49 TRINITY_DN6218_c0_g1_i1:658-969(+)